VIITKFIHECPLFIHMDEINPLFVHNGVRKVPKKVCWDILKYFSLSS
jgi:hypothetical protein